MRWMGNCQEIRQKADVSAKPFKFFRIRNIPNSGMAMDNQTVQRGEAGRREARPTKGDGGCDAGDSPGGVSPSIARCRAALEGEQLDRLPTYAPAIACAVASEILGRPALAGTGSLHYAEMAAWSDGEAAHAEFEERLRDDLIALARALDLDVFRPPWRCEVRPSARIDQYTFRVGPEAGEHTIWRYHPGTADFGVIKATPPTRSPEARLEDQVEHLERVVADGLAGARKRVARVVELHRRWGREFFVIGAGGNISVGLGADELEMMLTEPDLTRRKVDLQGELVVLNARAVVEAGCPPVLVGGGDLAGNDGPIYSPAAFRALLLPSYARTIEQLNALGVHYMFRSDGNLWSLMEMLFGEAGCHGYGEMDRDASMTVKAVREKYPDLVIWGNVSSSLLMTGTEEAVRQQALEVLEEAKGKGCFQGCSNAAVHGTPARNVAAMMAAR